MSSSDDHRETNASSSKKRKIQRACDVCRRKKIRCDGADMTDKQCSNCVAYGFECTYVEGAKKRGPPKGYVENLENRLEKMEKLIKQLVPDIDLSSSTALETLAFPKPPRTSVAENMCALVDPDQEETDENKAYSAMNIATLSIRAISNENATPSSDSSPAPEADPEVDPDEIASLTLADNMKRLTLENEYRFFGKSSGIMLIQTALDIKKEYAKAAGASESAIEPASSSSASPPPRLTLEESTKTWMSSSLRRPEFWRTRPWESGITNYVPMAPTPLLPSPPPAPHPPPTESPPNRYSFPPPDLMHDLIELYFEHSNAFLPLLHYPTFISQVTSGLHLRQGGDDETDGFASCLLLVCAVASRWSTDPRVRLDQLEGEKEFEEFGWHSNGWKWFNQVQLIRKSLLQPPGLWDLQFYCLSVMFLMSTSAPQACWTMVGIGIRLAQDVGAHRRKIRKAPSPSSSPSSWEAEARERIEEELWSRAWWVLVCLDRMLSSAMGRPCAIQDEDFDLEMPLVVDDEYWEDPSGSHNPSQMFKQPEGKPSLLAHFVLFIKLMKLLAFSLRTIYSINKSKILLGLVGTTWEQHIVAEIDSALNKWVDSVPPHLRWDPQHPDPLFFNQSSLLYAWYYHLQILIHRPFIPSPRKPSPLSFPSLAICTNAARGCCHVVDTHRRRVSGDQGQGRIRAMQPYNMIAVFTSGIVLLLNIWGGKKRSSSSRSERGSGIDVGKEMGDVHKCMLVLGLLEERWHSAGRLWDILAELASVGELPLPSSSSGSGSSGEPASMAAGSKRGRDEASEFSPPTASGGGGGGGGRSIASNKRVMAQQVQVQGGTQGQVVLFPPPQQQQVPQQQPSSSSTFSLPMYSNELGRLPLHAYPNPQSQPPQPPQPQPQQDWYPNPMGYPSFFQLGSGGDTGGGGGGSSFYTSPTPGPSLGTGHAHAHAHAQDFPSMLPQGLPPTPGFSGGILDNETMTMWSNAPSGFELDDWGAYLELAHQAQQGGV